MGAAAMDNRTGDCRNLDGALPGRVGAQARLKFRDGHWGAARFECLAGGQRVSARAGTADVGIRTELSP